MRSNWVRIGLLVVVVSLFMAATGAASTLLGPTYDLGQEILFEVEDASTWWWGWCCYTCEASWVHGWRVVNACGETVYTVTHEGPVASNIWQGTWSQLDMNGVSVPAGKYRLMVDTSAGTLSRCFTLRDPCASPCWWTTGCWCGTSCTYGCGTACYWCGCEEVRSIQQCGCRTSLVFVDPCRETWTPFYWWGCGSCCP